MEHFHILLLLHSSKSTVIIISEWSGLEQRSYEAASSHQLFPSVPQYRWCMGSKGTSCISITTHHSRFSRMSSEWTTSWAFGIVRGGGGAVLSEEMCGDRIKQFFYILILNKRINLIPLKKVSPSYTYNTIRQLPSHSHVQPQTKANSHSTPNYY